MPFCRLYSFYLHKYCFNCDIQAYSGGTQWILSAYFMADTCQMIRNISPTCDQFVGGTNTRADTQCRFQGGSFDGDLSMPTAVMHKTSVSPQWSRR